MLSRDIEQSTENAALDLEQQLEMLALKITQCTAMIETLKLDKQLLQEQVDALTERNSRIMSSMQELVKKLDDALCQTA